MCADRAQLLEQASISNGALTCAHVKHMWSIKCMWNTWLIIVIFTLVLLIYIKSILLGYTSQKIKSYFCMTEYNRQQMSTKFNEE